ncbi:LysR family transcriptional regulator [Pseudoalteromonas sp. G4]|uniref:LysR family transcriptional regulator n=1 Tax=Pseudoalteromonas sp. G4 TaxID=2992761 RepID=UPI00237EAF77|nr:LysR family transcriptional regulator [Pseudoalteromonas sp. G4]MDE3271835.1 LysR family transcriptional regulator [Pseudoalteromonas sp. G4]
MINPNLLRTFCTLVEQKHFTRTAQILCITQSGVSQHLRKLEDLLGAKLIVRDEKGFILTALGQRTYDEAKGIVSSLSSFKEKVRSDSKYSGEVKVMSPGSIGLALYLKLLEIQQEHVELYINYRFAPNDLILKSVEAQESDIGLLTVKPKNNAMQSTLVAEEKLALVTSKKYQGIDWQNLLDLGFINHPDGQHHAHLLLSKNFKEFSSVHQFKQKGFCNQIGLILEPVARGLGFTVLPENAVNSFPNQAQITRHSLTHEVNEKVYLVSYKSDKLSQRVQYILSQIETVLAETY